MAYIAKPIWKDAVEFDTCRRLAAVAKTAVAVERESLRGFIARLKWQDDKRQGCDSVLVFKEIEAYVYMTKTPTIKEPSLQYALEERIMAYEGWLTSSPSTIEHHEKDEDAVKWWNSLRQYADIKPESTMSRAFVERLMDMISL
jgi:hypothetical protein